MPTLRIEHSVPDFSGWKRAFDSDPADRKGSGVRRYQVSRSVEDPNFVMIDLEFDSTADAEGLLAKMRRIWSSGEGQKVMRNPQARIVESVEEIEL
jgi:ribosomal protein L35AE/L33A